MAANLGQALQLQITPLQAALGRIGFAPNQIVALMAQGLSDLGDMAMLTEENIREMGKRIYEEGFVNFPILAIQKLVVIHYWRRNTVNSGQVANAADINNVMLAEQSEAYQVTIDTKKNKSKDAETVVKPDKFIKPDKWRSFHGSIRAYLQSVQGSSGIPLIYVIREHDVPLPGTTYVNSLERQIANAPLNGTAYMYDNHKVHGILLSLVLEGPGYSFMCQHDETKDGRESWKSLLAHYEGRSYLEKRKNEAYKTINSIRYESKKRVFNFEKYITLHQNAHEDLRVAGEPMSERRKVTVFLQNIVSNNLISAVDVVRATPTLLNNFTETTNYLAGILNAKQPAGRPTHRSISDT